MGAETSILERCNLQGPYWELKYWNIYRVQVPIDSGSKSSTVSVFVSNSDAYEKNQKHEFMNNAIKNLKILRHPCVVKYVGSGCKSNRICVITEEVMPFRSAFKDLSPHLACAGLHAILKALAFFHETCHLCHNNLDTEALCVLPNGTWKIMGMEFMCKHSDCNEEFLNKTRSYRTEEVVSPEEKNCDFKHLKEHGFKRDIYSFGIVAKEILQNVPDIAEFPGSKEFMERLIKEVLCLDPALRPSASLLLQDKYFKNDFMDILLFLQNITLKSSKEKEDFFRELGCQLSNLPDTLIASQLADLILSRVILIDSAAESFFPCFFGTKSESPTHIFSENVFKESIIPKLSTIFQVHDLNVRLVLLKYFNKYVHLFSKDDLSSHILPQILLGLKDNEDILVEGSLNALSRLVPILGSSIVIGGERGRYFFEGKPKDVVKFNLMSQLSTVSDVMVDLNKEQNRVLANILPNNSISELDLQEECLSSTESELDNRNDNPLIQSSSVVAVTSSDSLSEVLLERSSPDGGEATNENCAMNDAVVDDAVVDDSDGWSDWEGLYNNNENKITSTLPETVDSVINSDSVNNNNMNDDNVNSEAIDAHPHTTITNNNNNNAILTKIQSQRASSSGLGEEYDVKAVLVKPVQNRELDLFADMEPVIQATKVLKSDDEPVVSDINTSLFDVMETEQQENIGWDLE